MPAMYRLATILILVLSAVRLDASRPLSLEDYYKIENASAPEISPDGRWVVFVRNSIIEGDNQRHAELWITPTDGSAQPVRLSDPAMNASAPKWSPDGKLLSFRSRRRAARVEKALSGSCGWNRARVSRSRFPV